ncbi:MAG TPA: hypothetical protein VFO83_04180 [Aggregicoccus sp.]|nr:hypothetical protein [Aggregicoccus sp.]
MGRKDSLFPDKKAPHEVPMAPRTGGPAHEGGPAIRPQEGPSRTPGLDHDTTVVETEHTRDPYPGVKVT